MLATEMSLDGSASVRVPVAQSIPQITSASVGTETARRLLAGAADEARKGREQVVDRYGLRKALEA